jgi:hypothetical protein
MRKEGMHTEFLWGNLLEKWKRGWEDNIKICIYMREIGSEEPAQDHVRWR